MSTLTPEVRADLALLRQQTAEVRRAVVTAHRLGAERSATVIRLRDRGVPFRVIAAAMNSSIAAVQSILSRADQRVTEPAAAGVLGAGAALTAGAVAPATDDAVTAGTFTTTLKAGAR